MKEYVTALLDKSPHLRNQILLFSSKHMTGSATLINDIIKAIYADKTLDKKRAYNALYGFIRSFIDSTSILPRPEYLREGLQKEKIASNAPAHMFYRQLEEAVSQEIGLIEGGNEEIERALDHMIDCTKAYNAAYSSNKTVASHADKTGEIIGVLESIRGSELSVMVKFKEMQRLIKTELEHKGLTDKQYREYQTYLDKNKAISLIGLVASKEFVGSGHSFSKAMLAILRFSEEFAVEKGIDKKLQESLNDYHEVGLRVLGRNVALFSEIFSSVVKEASQIEVIKVILPRLYQLAITDLDHKEVYKAIREFFINTKEGGYQRALIELLAQEDRIIDDIVRYVIAFEEAQRIMKQFEGLVISDDMIASRVDAHQEKLVAYTVDSALRAIRNICSEQKDISNELSKIIGSSSINALEKMDAVKAILQIKEPKLSSKDIPNLEEELMGYDYRVLGDNNQRTLLLRSVRGLNEAKTREYVVRALQFVIASYDREILLKATKADYVPEVNAMPTAVGERPRAMSTRIRGRSFISSIPAEATVSPKAGSNSPGSSSQGYDPTLFGGRNQGSGSTTPEKDDSPTHSRK